MSEPLTDAEMVARLMDENARLRRALLQRAAVEVGAARLPSWWGEVVTWANAMHPIDFGDNDPPYHDHRDEFARLIMTDRGRQRVVPVERRDILNLNTLIDVAEAKR